MTPERKAELFAELEEQTQLPLDTLTPFQQAFVKATQAVWGGDEITPAKERWAARQLHLPAERRRRAINSVWARSFAAKKMGE
jgi:hypothetical protein